MIEADGPGAKPSTEAGQQMLSRLFARSAQKDEMLGRTQQVVAPGEIPVTLLTGFLGSGKTTFLNDLLTDPRMGETAIIVNEFGSVSVDHDLIRKGSEQYILTSTGCLCCTATSDIRASLHELLLDRCKGEIPPFKRVIIETTGLADPAPIVNSLIPGGAPAVALRDHVVARSYRLAGVVATFDVQAGEASLADHFECWKQLAFADHIVLTKTDLLPGAGWHEKLRAINPTVVLTDRNAPDFDPVAMIVDANYSVSDKPEDVLGWLAMERYAGSSSHDQVHDPNRHGASIEAMGLFHDEPLDPRAVETFLGIMTSQPHAG
ncbi:CobW family GTP-binding protein, partial [Brucella intermedia]